MQRGDGFAIGIQLAADLCQLLECRCLIFHLRQTAQEALQIKAKILVDAGVAGTASEARRLIDGGGVKVNGEALAPKAYNVAPEVLAGAEVQVGKKKFVRFE